MTFESKLVNKCIANFGRAANMAWIALGEEVEVVSVRLNKILKKNEFAIHLQCPWRIEDIQQKKIILASSDIYQPKDEDENIEDFNWDIQGNNLFDQKSNLFIKGNNSLIISDFRLMDYNDLFILISDRYLLRTFIDNSLGEESWRILDNVDKKHYVCTEGHVEVV